jgi:hypothetical protein
VVTECDHRGEADLFLASSDRTLGAVGEEKVAALERRAGG